MVSTAGSLKRGLRNVIRNPVRLVLVIVLLGASLTFTAAMFALNSGSQTQINTVRAQVGTGIDVAPSFTGGFQVLGTISGNQVTAAKTVPGVVGITQTVRDQYTGSNLYGTAKIPKQFRQFGFQRFQSSGGSGFGFPGRGSGNRSKGGGFQFRRRLLNGGKGSTIPPSVTGVTGAANGITVSGTAIHLAKGRDLTTSDKGRHVALMSEALAKANKLVIGSSFKLKGIKTTLVGEFTASSSTVSSPFPGRSTAGNSIIVPIAFAQKIFKLNGVTDLTVYANTVSNVDHVAKLLQSKLGNNVTVSPTADTYAATISALNSTSHNIQVALIASIITAALVIVFAVFIIVRERTREIGVLKAIGASSTNIVAQFTSEVLGMTVGAAAVAALLLAVFGGQIAAKFNISTADAASGPFGFARPGGGFSGTPTFFRDAAAGVPLLPTTPLNAGLTGSSLLLLLGLAIGLAVLASWVPTWYVSRLQPARVLSNA